MATQRAPARAAGPSAQARPEPAADDDDSFPDSYDQAQQSPSPLGSALSPLLDAGLDRLIDLAAGCLGCPHEEVLDLKSRAAANPEPIRSYCQMVFDQRIRPLREAADPLLASGALDLCAFWLEGPQGRSIARAPQSDILAPYNMATIELHDPMRTPFAKYYQASTDADKGS